MKARYEFENDVDFHGTLDKFEKFRRQMKELKQERVPEKKIELIEAKDILICDIMNQIIQKKKMVKETDDKRQTKRSASKMSWKLKKQKDQVEEQHES